MASYTRLVAALAAIAAPVLAQQTLYGQCGGIGWSGATTCVSGACCVYQNDYYSQCLTGSCSSPSTSTSTSTSASASTSTTSSSGNQASGSFTNPVLWEDLADNDVFRVGSTYYYTASNMHYSPGAPILRSYDLANWEYIGHAVPVLDWSTKYYLPSSGERAYVKGTWASSMRYRPSNGLYYFVACIEFSKSYIYTASDPSGTWTKRATISTCFYDAGLLVDEDTDTLYVAYGNTQLSVAQLSADGFSVVKTAQVYSSSTTLEGSRFYKKDGRYYIFVTQPANAQWILRSTGSDPFGSYEIKNVVNNIGPPVSGSGYPHQGSLVDTPAGQWYYMAFIDNYPGGRVPVLAPVTWATAGWPVVTTVNGAWGSSYPYTLPQHTVTSTTGTDTFSSSSLSPMYEWNHNPDTSSFSVGSGLTLRTASVTSDLYQARNTLTRRIHGPIGTATLELDFSNMADGDRAGLVLLRDDSTWIGIKNDGGSFTLCVVNGITMNSDWTTSSTGATQTSQAVSKGKIWLRGTADIKPSGSKQASFSYSLDGNSYTSFGPTYTMGTAWQFFMGYRWGIFNYATKALGGSVTAKSFTSA